VTVRAKPNDLGDGIHATVLFHARKQTRFRKGKVSLLIARAAWCAAPGPDRRVSRYSPNPEKPLMMKNVFGLGIGHQVLEFVALVGGVDP
jgi:hypothetical protein